MGPAVLGEPPLLLVRLGEELLHLLLQVHEAPGQPAQQWVIFWMREWSGAFPDCGPLAEDSAAKLKRSQLIVCTVYVYCVRWLKLVQDWLVISVIA